MGASPDILIFEDDPVSAEMIAAVAREVGYSSEKLLHGAGALEKIRALRPRAVVLDLMMPGLDGMSVLRAIKAAPDTASVPVIVVTGKPYRQDRETAQRCGAALFFQKPLDVVKFQEALFFALGADKLLGSAEGPGPSSRPPAFEARIWGCRGAGGTEPTCCASVALDGRLLVLDAGTGLERLCLQAPASLSEILVLLTHYHPAHVEGLRSLAGLDAPGRKLLIAGPADAETSLQRLVGEALGSLASRAQVFALGEARF